MIVNCTCDEVGTLPADIEPAIFDRNPDGLCEVCKEEPFTEVCTCGAWREFVTPQYAMACCRTCHNALHVVAFETFSKRAAETHTE